MSLPAVIATGNLLTTPSTVPGTGEDCRILRTDPGEGPFPVTAETPLPTAAANADAFQRTRVSEPATVADCSCEYDAQPLIMDTLTAGSGAIVHSAPDSSVVMSVTTASGDSVIRQSRQYCTYQKGKSHLILVTGTLGAATESRTSGMGYGDDDDGVFLVQRETGPALLWRSSVSGSTVETYVDQADWNVNTVSNLDLAKSQILVIDLQWLGVGRVRVGLDMDGEIALLHEFENDNRNISTYWRTGTLPVRYWIENTGTTASAGSMRQICWSVQSEGALELERGFAFSSANTADVSASGATPLISIRPKASFLGAVNRVGVIPTGLESVADTAILLQVVYNGTLTGASWADVDATNSACEWDQAATAITGGIVLWSGFVPATGARVSAINQAGFPALLWLTNSIAGTATTPLTLVATPFTGTVATRGALRWVEVR